MPIRGSRLERSSLVETSLHLDDAIVNDKARLQHSNETKNRGKAKLLISRLYTAITKRIDSQRNVKDRTSETIKQEYVIEDDPKSRTWCDITIPNSISIAPDTPTRSSKKDLNPMRSSGQILDRSDYLAILAKFSANDHLTILRRAAKQFSIAYSQGTLRERAPSVAAKQYYTFYHVQIAVELCQYQPENDFFPAPNAYNLEYGIQCLNKCLTLDRFLLYCDATRLEYERQTGLIVSNSHQEGSKTSMNRDDILKTIKELEHYRRHLDRGSALSPNSNKA